MPARRARADPARICRDRRGLPGQRPPRKSAKHIDITDIYSLARRLRQPRPRAAARVSRVRTAARSVEKRHGYLWRTHHGRHRPARAVVRARKRLRQHRELADDRVQAHRHRRSRISSRTTFRAARRRATWSRSRARPTPCRATSRTPRSAPSWRSTATGFFVVAKPSSFVDGPAGVRRHQSLHAPRRFPAQQGRLSGQRRRLLPDGHPGRSDDRQPGRQRAASCCSSRTTSCRRSRRPQIDYRANLASYPLTQSHDTSVPGSELLNPVDFTANPIGDPAAVGARSLGAGRDAAARRGRRR